MSETNPWFDHFERQTKPGAEQCPYSCPVCMTLSMVRQMRPEVAQHLVAAGREFFLAAKAFLDSVSETGDTREPGIEKIVVEGDETPQL